CRRVAYGSTTGRLIVLMPLHLHPTEAEYPVGQFPYGSVPDQIPGRGQWNSALCLLNVIWTPLLMRASPTTMF
ncbi:MAG: hypothetical protein WAK17_08810, partial [Candidatus Nitrosopolaris sp.]